MKRILYFITLFSFIFTCALTAFGGEVSSEQDLDGNDIILAQNMMIPGDFTKSKTPNHNLKGKATPWVYGDSTSGAQIYYNSDYDTKDIDIFKFDGEYGDIIRCSFLLPPDEYTFDGAINLVNVDSISYKIEDDSAGGCDEVLDYRLWESGTYYLVLGKWNELKEGPYKKNVYEGDDKAFYTMKLEHFPSPEISVTPDSINLGYISSKEIVTDQLEITNTGPAGAADLEFNIDFGYIIPILFESFENFPPDGWTIEGGMNWQGSNTNNAGGTPPEAEFYWSPSTTGMQRLITPVLNTTDYTELPLTFKHYVNDYDGGYTIGVATTSDGGTTWNDVWTLSPTGDVGPETINTTISTADVGSEDFQMCFYFDGDSYNINWWDIDDVFLYIGNVWASAEPDAGSIPQGETMAVDINADPMGLEDGFYEATINLHNNALPAGVSDLQIPLNFYIGEPAGGLEGTVRAAGTGEPLQGVKVSAGNFFTYTDSLGFFEFDNMALGTYDVTFEKEYYQTRYVVVPLDPYYTIVLNIDLCFLGPPPRNFVAECGCGCCHLSWEEPDLGGGAGVNFILDDGSSENGWAINPGNEAWLGNHFPVADVGELISFDVYGEQTVGAGDETVTIDIFDDEHNLVGTTAPFVIPAGGWTTVSAPNIPFDGEFYAMVHWDELLSETNYMGFDEDGPNANANYDWYYDGSTWELMHESIATNPGVCMLRAKAVIDSNFVNLSPDPKKVKKETAISKKSGINYESVKESKKAKNAANWNNRATKDLTILGYNIYEEEKGFVAFVDSEIRDFTDELVQIGHEYTYWVTAVYNQGEGLPSNTDSCIPYLSGGWWEDFHEDWATTGNWYLDPASPNNWEYYANDQCARLSWSPSTTNYDMSLVSEEFILPYFLLGACFEVNMYINDYSTDTGEIMEIWIIHDGEEIKIFEWDLDVNDEWGVSGGQDWVYDDMDQFIGETVQIKFRSHGSDTYNFNYWYIYSVLVDFYVGPIEYGTLEGVVTDTDMNPLPNATVTAGNHEAVTDSNGYYMMEYLVTGTYEVIASHENYNTSDPVTVEILEDQTTVRDLALTQPTLEVNPTTIQEYVTPDDPISVDVTVANNGDGPLNYYINLIRGVQTDYSNCTSGTPTVKSGQTSENNSNGFIAENTSRDDVIIHYDGPNEDGIGLINGGTFMVAARFTSDELGDYYGGYQLSNVKIYIRDMPSNATLKVWEGGSMGDPGTEIYSEDITGQISQESWTTINLNTPIELIADNEYWIGYEVTHDAGLFPVGCDAGHAVDGKGDWIYFNSAWDELQNYGFDYNWNIRAVLSPGVIYWITFSPDSGYVEAGSSDIVTVDFNTSSYSLGDTLTAQLLFSSEPDVGTQNVDIEITVGEYTIADTIEISHTEISKIFPNPAPDAANIKYTIKQPTQVKLSVFNIKGQLVEILVDEHYDRGIYELEWNPKNISTGIYFLQLKTEDKTFLEKMIMMR